MKDQRKARAYECLRLRNLRWRNQRRSNAKLSKIPLFDDPLARTDNRRRRTKRCISTALIKQSKTKVWAHNLLSDSNTNVNSMINRRVSLFYRYPLKAFHHMVWPCTLYGVCVVCPGTSELVGQHTTIRHWSDRRILSNPACNLCEMVSGTDAQYLDYVPADKKNEFVETGLGPGINFPCGALSHTCDEWKINVSSYRWMQDLFVVATS